LGLQQRTPSKLEALIEPANAHSCTEPIGLCIPLDLPLPAPAITPRCMDRRPFALALDWTLGITCACLTGSIPALAQPHLWPPEPAPEGITLRWTDAGPGRAYTVQVRDRL
jgi:hypothetical protein